MLFSKGGSAAASSDGGRERWSTSRALRFCNVAILPCKPSTVASTVTAFDVCFLPITVQGLV